MEFSIPLFFFNLTSFESSDFYRGPDPNKKRLLCDESRTPDPRPTSWALPCTGRARPQRLTRSSPTNTLTTLLLFDLGWRRWLWWTVRVSPLDNDLATVLGSSCPSSGSTGTWCLVPAPTPTPRPPTFSTPGRVVWTKPQCISRQS